MPVIRSSRRRSIDESQLPFYYPVGQFYTEDEEEPPPPPARQREVMPWERASISVYEFSPQQKFQMDLDQAQAAVDARVRRGDPFLDAPSRLDREIMAPLRTKWNIPDMRSAEPVEDEWVTYETEDGVQAVNRRTLEVRQLTKREKPPADPVLSWPMSDPALGSTFQLPAMRGPPSAFSRAFDTLPPYARTNETAVGQMRMYGYDPTTGSFLGQTNAPSGALATTGDPNELVDVFNPSGVQKRIKRSDLPRALRGGYRLR